MYPFASAWVALATVMHMTHSGMDHLPAGGQPASDILRHCTDVIKQLFWLTVIKQCPAVSAARRVFPSGSELLQLHACRLLGIMAKTVDLEWFSGDFRET